MAASPNTDALGLLSAALHSDNDYDEAQHLAELYSLLKLQPGNIPILLPSLISLLPKTSASIRTWIANVMDLAFCRPSLSQDSKNTLATHAPDAILLLVKDNDQKLAKTAAQCFASMYPALFRLVCSDRAKHGLWKTVLSIKAHVVHLFDHGSKGTRIAAIKCYQRIIQVQSRAADPRSQPKNDTSLNGVPGGHPFLQAAALEEESNQLFTQLITLVFTSQVPDLVMAAINSLTVLAKSRPHLCSIVLQAMSNWSPASMTTLSHTQIRNVEKTVRIFYLHFIRNQLAGTEAVGLQKALEAQQRRMEDAAKTYAAVRETEAKRKREAIDHELESPKRPKLEVGAVDTAGGQAFLHASTLSTNGTNSLASFDVKTLPTTLVIDLIIANLQALTEPELQSAIARMRHNLDPANEGTSQPPVQQSAQSFTQSLPSSSVQPLAGPSVYEDNEVADPLKVDMAEEDLDTLPTIMPDEEEEAEELSPAVIENFALAPPEYLSMSESDSLIKDTITRICEYGFDVKVLSATQTLWSTLVIRLATRGFADSAGAESNGSDKTTRTLSFQADIIRSMLLEFVKADFVRRSRFAVSWMAEEWFCDRLRHTTNYATWLEKLVQAWIPTIDAKDKTLAVFLADLPEISATVMELIAALSRDKSKMMAGLSTLQDICVSRPMLRNQAADILLQLTRTSERSTRARAIIAIKQCAGSNTALESTILAFARSSLDLLIDTPEQKDAEVAPGDKTADAEPVSETEPAAKDNPANAPQEEALHPVDQDDVLRFVELPFSLCTKIPDMLDEIFSAYPRTPKFVQAAIEKHIVNLIRALGSSHPRLLTLLRDFPAGADSLALCILKILTERNRSPALVELVKELVDERDVDPRFLVPIMPDLDKAEILQRLPKVVTVLATKAPEDRALVKSVFQSIIHTPAQGFGSVSTNLPRLRQTELLTPVELMGLLHHSEKEIGLKNAVAAIQICFSMTEVYRAEVLAAVLNQISEDQNLPMLFMRTVIMAVSTYKSLSGYVSKNLLSRLITKKIWLNPPLWDGFIICAKQTAPSSFGALIQLPKDQLREVVNRQPDLRTGLADYLTARAGGNSTRLATFMDLLGPEPDPEA